MNKRLKRRLFFAVVIGSILVILLNVENCYAYFRATQKRRNNIISTATFSFSTENINLPFKIQTNTKKETVTVKNTGTIPLQFDVTHLSTSQDCKDLLFYETDNNKTRPLSRFLPRKIESKKTHTFVIYLAQDTERSQEFVCDISFSIEAWQVNFHSNKRGFTQTAKLHYQLAYVPPKEIDVIDPVPVISEPIPPSEEIFEKEVPTSSAPKKVEAVPIEQQSPIDCDTAVEKPQEAPASGVNSEAVEPTGEESLTIVN